MMPIGSRVTVDTSGLDGLVSEAKKRSITLKAVRAGIKVLVPAARANAPRRPGSGALKQSQAYRAAKGRKGKTIAFAVQGARKNKEKVYKGKVIKPGSYDHLVQGGTRPHRTGAGEKLSRFVTLVNSTKAIPGTSQSTGRRHPGAKANPYRRRAFESRQQAVIAATEAKAGEELQKEIERQASRMKT